MSLRALQGPTGGGAPVGGSGTSSPSTIPRWTGASTLGDSVITQSGSNIGIGTASPGYKLDVNGSINSQQPFYINGGSQGFITWAGAAANTLNVMGSAGRALSLGSNGVYDRLYLDTSGNVGIGTASPTAALDVPASTTTRATLRVRSGVAPTAPNTGDVWFDGTSLFMRNGAGTQTVSFGGGGGATAWVNFNGTGVVTIRGDAGVSSVSDGGVGVYTVNFDSALSDANFAAPTSAWYEGVAAGAMGVTARTTTSVTLKTVATQTGALVDMLECHCAIFR